MAGNLATGPPAGLNSDDDGSTIVSREPRRSILSPAPRRAGAPAPRRARAPAPRRADDVLDRATERHNETRVSVRRRAAARGRALAAAAGGGACRPERARAS
jgi:hypothetical protein